MRDGMEPALTSPGWGATWAGLWGLTWRSTWPLRRWPMLALGVLLAPLLAWLALPWGEREPFIGWVLGVHFGLLIPLWCLIAFGSFVRDEVQAGTIGFLLTRPMTRVRFFLLRWFCTLMTVQGALAANTLLLGVAGLILDVPGVLRLTGLLLAAQLVVVPAYGAVAALLGVLTRKYLLLGLVYGFVVEVGIGQIPTNINTLSVARHFRNLLDQFELIELAAGWSGGAMAAAAGWLLLLTLVYLIAAATVFHAREFRAGEESPRS